MTGDQQFFTVTKGIHNALQGAPFRRTTGARETYLMYNTRNAQLLEGAYDVVFLHDPQPLALRAFAQEAGARGSGASASIPRSPTPRCRRS